MFIENDSIMKGIMDKNRCYVWDRIKQDPDNKQQAEDNMNFDDLVVNDEYAGKTKAKVV